MTKVFATRYHDFSCGHRVVGHENKCKYLHGHNYRVTFHCQAEKLDSLGRVVDFGVIKSTLCDWLEYYWDHKTLLWVKDPLLPLLQHPMLQWAFSSTDDPTALTIDQAEAVVELHSSLVSVPFNPTAENMGLHLLTVVGPELLKPGGGVKLTRVEISETRKCSAVVEV